MAPATIPPTYIRVRSVVWECGEGQTHRHRDTRTAVTNIHFASVTLHAKFNYKMFCRVSRCPARVVGWLDHLDAMCSRAWRALCAVASRFNSSRGPGKARPPT